MKAGVRHLKDHYIVNWNCLTVLNILFVELIGLLLFVSNLCSVENKLLNC